jgi:hypothetical protein
MWRRHDFKDITSRIPNITFMCFHGLFLLMACYYWTMRLIVNRFYHRFVSSWRVSWSFFQQMLTCRLSFYVFFLRWMDMFQEKSDFQRRCRPVRSNRRHILAISHWICGLTQMKIKFFVVLLFFSNSLSFQVEDISACALDTSTLSE